MTAKRPICGHCGKPYGQRATKMEHFRWKEGEPKPQYRGNGVVTKETEWAASGTMGHVGGLEFKAGDMVGTRYVWDGETYWGGYDPFCTLRCALDYARRAYNTRKGVKT